MPNQIERLSAHQPRNRPQVARRVLSLGRAPTMFPSVAIEIDVVLGDSADPDEDLIPACLAIAEPGPSDIGRLGEHRIGCGAGRYVPRQSRLKSLDYCPHRAPYTAQ